MRTRPARLVATDGHRQYAVVAINLRRKAGAAVHYPGAEYAYVALSCLSPSGLFAAGLRRHLLAFPPRLREADGNCLLATGYLLPRAAAFERSALLLVHRLLNFLRRRR